jgi:hypothetical protein
MSGFPKKERQRIVDEYLQATGRNMFVPGEFVDWLKEQAKSRGIRVVLWDG